MDDGEIIWDDFFATSAGLNYLDDLAWKCNVKVHRDSRKNLLTLYGSSHSKNEILLALAARNTRLIATTYYIRLNTEEDINKARNGGFRRIVAALGKEHASIDLRSRIKVITIVGTFQDSEMARKLLDCNTASDVRKLSLEGVINNPDCVVCYTEADQVYRTPCGHIYCASCFAHQCASAADQNIPLRCLGASGECAQVFSLRELKNTLRSEAFERLLEDSFAMHIRTQPKVYQYCPTPDCKQIYSTSMVEFESVFTCPKCLTPICTSCRVVQHDGKSTLYLPHATNNQLINTIRHDMRILQTPRRRQRRLRGMEKRKQSQGLPRLQGPDPEDFWMQSHGVCELSGSHLLGVFEDVEG